MCEPAVKMQMSVNITFCQDGTKRLLILNYYREHTFYWLRIDLRWYLQSLGLSVIFQRPTFRLFCLTRLQDGWPDAPRRGDIQLQLCLHQTFRPQRLRSVPLRGAERHRPAASRRPPLDTRWVYNVSGLWIGFHSSVSRLSIASFEVYFIS